MKHLILPIFGLLSAGIWAFAADTEQVLFEEKFTADPGAGWSWVREEPKAWKVEKGVLALRTLPGYLHGNYNNSRNILLRKPPETNKGLIVEVFLENQPMLQYEHAGLVWYYDDDHYVSLWKEKTGKEQEVLMVHEKETKPRFAQARYEGATVWLRLVIAEGKATSFYRPTDKDEWKQVGQFELPVKGEPKVGLGSGCGPKDGERQARFSHFRILETAK
jgi:regulation of enolase protein 1 (concanavalin A-like superfamily)